MISGIIIKIVESACHIGVVGRMATRPVVLPETFSGAEEGSTWTDWKFHFDNVATVNAWDEAAKLKWLKVRLTGRAQRAVQLLPAATVASLDLTVKALEERFEPAIKKNRYQAEFQSRKKKRTESWADFADDLKALADKGYPDLGDNGTELLAIQAYLQQLEPPQVAFSVKQKRPTKLVDAVTTTIEMESYLPQVQQKPTAPVSAVGGEGTEGAQEIASVQQNATTLRLAGLVEKLAERVEKLESTNRQGSQSRNRRQPGQYRSYRGPCWECGKHGHIARNCPTQSSRQGN